MTKTYITELVYDNRQKRDVAHKIPFDYDPSIYTTKEDAAKGLYNALLKFAAEYGIPNPEKEVILFTPERSEEFGTGRNWRVSWECGPYQWAIAFSFQCKGPWGYTEPYYSFDLCFTE